MIGPILRSFIIFITLHRNYTTYSHTVNEVEGTGTAIISVDEVIKTFIYKADTKTWEEKTPADELLHAVKNK